MTLYRCKHCGNIIAHIKDSGVCCECCGEEMEALVPNTADAAGEKHHRALLIFLENITNKNQPDLERSELIICWILPTALAGKGFEPAMDHRG